MINTTMKEHYSMEECAGYTACGRSVDENWTDCP